jgi:hypothetical protein
MKLATELRYSALFSMNPLFHRLRETAWAPHIDGKPDSPPAGASGVLPTLEIAGERRIPAPTDTQIREAVLSLDACTTYAFLILDRDARHSMEVSGDAREGFEVEHYEGGTGRRFRATGDFAAEPVSALLIAYRDAAPGWRETVAWEELDL